MDTTRQESKPLHADLLTQDFQVSADYGVICHLYELTGLALYGLLLPCEINPSCPELFSYKYKMQIPEESVQKLKKFQDVFWRSVTLNTMSASFKRTNVNILIVPLANNQPDFELIKQINSGQSVDIWSDQQVFQNTNSSSLCEMIHEFKLGSSSEEFLIKFLGEDYEDLYSFIEHFRGMRAIDLINQDFPFPAVQQFHKSLQKTDTSDETHVCIVRQMQPAYAKTRSNNVNNRKLVLMSTLQPHPLTMHHWNESTLLMKSLLKIEQYSYVAEFSMRFGYTGSLRYLIQAFKLPIADNLHNYDPIETIGDCVLKALTTIQLFIEYPTYTEEKLTINRSYIVSNDFLCVKQEEFGLSRYIMGREVPITKYRPPYYTGSIMNEARETTELVSDRMKADILEAQIGAFFLGHGISDALNYLYNLRILERNETVMQYLNRGNLCLLSKECLTHYSFPKETNILNLFPRPSKDIPTDLYDLGEYIGYSFQNIGILRDALTHKSFGPDCYERLEFLGDAILDFVVVSNLYALDESLTAEELTSIKQSIVRKSVIAKFSVLLHLHRFLVATNDLVDMCQVSVGNIDWNENLIKFIQPKDNPIRLIGDVFESTIAAIFMDSRDFSVTVQVVTNWIKFILIYMVQNKAAVKSYNLKRSSLV